MQTILFIAASIILFASLLLITVIFEALEDTRTETITKQRKEAITLFLFIAIVGIIVSASTLYCILKPILTPINPLTV